MFSYFPTSSTFVGIDAFEYGENGPFPTKREVGNVHTLCVCYLCPRVLCHE